MNREDLVKIFHETVNIVSKEPEYISPNGKKQFVPGVGETITYRDFPKFGFSGRKYETTEVKVINGDCLEVAKEVVKRGDTCAVLNMASFKRPGGGVLFGSSSQEESLFRRTNLAMSLYPFSVENFGIIGVEKAIDGVYPLPINGGAIYSKFITVFRAPESKSCELMDDPFEIDVITIAAIKNPPLSEDGKLSTWVVSVLRNKVTLMLRLCVLYNIDVPVLGAFGCGAYGTPPEQMAEIFKEVLLSGEFDGAFKAVLFPIIDNHNTHKEHNPNGNFKPFLDILPKQI